MKYIAIIILVLANGNLLLAQSFSKALAKTDSALSFIEQAEKISRFLDTATGQNRIGYKQWKRKEWFANHHVDSSGRLVDYIKKNYEAIEQADIQRNRQTNNFTSGAWQSIGYHFSLNDPLVAFQGRVNCIAFHPTNPDIIYIGTAGGGIWKSTNAGMLGSWINISDNLPVTCFSGLTIAQDGNTIYALTGDGHSGNFYIHDGVGVLKSNDAGISWQRTGRATPLSEMRGGYKIKIHPSNSNTVFAATNTGLWQTVDGGESWNMISTYTEVTDFEFKPNDANIIYYTVAGRNLVVKRNLTTSVESEKSIVGEFTRIEISVTTANPEAVYALGGPGFAATGTGTPNGTANYRGFYYLNDWTGNFILRNNNLNVFVSEHDQSFYDICMDVNSSNSNEIIIGGVNACRSTDGGSNFSFINSNLHADQHVIERNPLNGYLYLGNDGGIYRSTNNGADWSNISLNLVINEFYRISGSQVNNNLILGGTQDNGQFLRNSNSSAFLRPLGNDGMDNIIDHSNPDIMYACYQNGGLNKTTTGGVNTSDWTNITPGTGPWITPILQSPISPGTIFYGSNTGILRTTNGGTSWSNIGGYNKATSMAISNSGTRLIITDGWKIKISNNPIATTPGWTNEINIHAPLLNVYPISAIAINPANENDIIVTFKGYTHDIKVFRSTNGGNNWFNYTINLPDIPIYSVTFASNNNNPLGGVYIGTEIGVFYKDDNLPGWEPFYNGLPRVPVTDLFVHFTTNDVTAATFGRGIWRSQGRSSCTANLPLTGTTTGNKFYQASATITSNQEMPGTAGNSLKLRAGNTIRLTDGFRAYRGSYLQALNTPCGSNIDLPAARINPYFKKNLKKKKRPK